MATTNHWDLYDAPGEDPAEAVTQQSMTATEVDLEILDGTETSVWTYDGYFRAHALEVTSSTATPTTKARSVGSSMATSISTTRPHVPGHTDEALMFVIVAGSESMASSGYGGQELADVSAWLRVTFGDDDPSYQH